MKKIAVVDFQSELIAISGDLDFSNAMTVYQQVLPRFSDYSQLVIDFSALKAGNSAVIAFMVACRKEADRLRKSIKFRHIPDKIQSVAIASGLQHLLESTP